MEELDVTRLPRNIEAEQALLGALLANNKAYEKVSEFLRADHFSDPIHAKVYEVMVRLIAKGHVADVITLKNYFEQEGTLNEVGGISYLVQLSESSTPLTNVEYYARFVYDKYLRRELIATGYDMAGEAMGEDIENTTARQIEKAEKRLFDLAMHGDGQRGFQNFGTSLTSALQVISKAFENKGKIAGLPSGFQGVDQKLGGLNKSNLIIVAGRPAMGKTAFALNIAYNVAAYMHEPSHNVPLEEQGVAFFSLEMSAEELVGRVLSSVTETPSMKMKNGDLDKAEFNRIVTAAREYQTLPLYIDDTPGIDINSIRARARRLKRTNGLGLIIIDYIQLITGSGDKKSEGNRVQEVSEISRGLKILAKELEVPVIALSQLNRGLENRDNKRPQMSDLRESGSIEQDADSIMFVYRENVYVQNMKPQSKKPEETDEKFMQRLEEWEKLDRETANKGTIIIGKNRHGERGDVDVFFDGRFTRFSDMTPPERLPEERG